MPKTRARSTGRESLAEGRWRRRVVSWAGPGARGTVRNVPERRGTRRRRRRRCAWTAWWRRVPAEGGETGAERRGSGSGNRRRPPPSSERVGSVERGGWSRGMRVARGIKRESQGPRRLRLGAVRFCAVARVRRTRTSGRTGSGQWRAGWRYCCALPTTGIDCVLPRCSRRDDRSFVGRDDHIVSQSGALLRY